MSSGAAAVVSCSSASTSSVVLAARCAALSSRAAAHLGHQSLNRIYSIAVTIIKKKLVVAGHHDYHLLQAGAPQNLGARRWRCSRRRAPAAGHAQGATGAGARHLRAISGRGPGDSCSAEEGEARFETRGGCRASPAHLHLCLLHDQASLVLLVEGEGRGSRCARVLVQMTALPSACCLLPAWRCPLPDDLVAAWGGARRMGCALCRLAAAAAIKRCSNAHQILLPDHAAPSSCSFPAL